MKRDRGGGRLVAASVVKQPPAILLPYDCRRVVGPMVGASDLPFRLLCRRYGATAAATQMLPAAALLQALSAEEAAAAAPADDSRTPLALVDGFLEDPSTLLRALRSCEADRPLVVQLCGNDPQTLADAALAACHFLKGDSGAMPCAIDLNLGCPQKRATEQCYGSALLDGEANRARAASCVAAMHHALQPLGVAVTVKLRLWGEEDTLGICERLRDHGAALVAIHGRSRGTATLRRDGPADLPAIGRVVQVVSSRDREASRVGGEKRGTRQAGGRAILVRHAEKEEKEEEEEGEEGETGAGAVAGGARPRFFPVLSNGNIRCGADVGVALGVTGAAGVMSAEGLLRDPSLFAEVAAAESESGYGAAGAGGSDGGGGGAGWERGGRVEASKHESLGDRSPAPWTPPPGAGPSPPRASGTPANRWRRPSRSALYEE